MLLQMKLADIFTDNMVLQRDKKIAVFGEGIGNGKIEFCGKETEFISENERFCVYLPPGPAGGPYSMRITLNGETVILQNILVGDVFLAAGQSNMELTCKDTVDIEIIPNDSIRFFTEGHNCNETLSEIYYNKTLWEICNEHTAQNFSAIGYCVARILQETVGVPIGIVACNKGASRVEAWTNPEIVNDNEYQKMLEIKHNDYNFYRFNQNSWLYINKLLPVVPYTARGVLWYQGESNSQTDEGIYYSKLLRIMIDNWRELWNDNLPFYQVQLMPLSREKTEYDMAVIRSQQALAAEKIPNVYLTTLVNTNEADNIHPTKKSKISKALANAVLFSLYGYDIEYCGPVINRIEKTKDAVILHFTHAEGLIVVGNELQDVYLYDENGRECAFDYKIEDNCLKLFGPQVVNCRQISFGYRNAPMHNLYNSDGFLASPFKKTLEK